MIAGAFVGGVIGGAGLEGTVSCMITGAQSIMPAILRIVTSGILAGVLIQSGAAVKIADQCSDRNGDRSENRMQQFHSSGNIDGR